jgi:hypothetical protein
MFQSTGEINSSVEIHQKRTTQEFFWETMLKLIRSENLEYKELTGA